MAEPRTATFDLTTLLPGPYLCAECAARVCTGASRLAGVLEAECDEAALRLIYDPAVVSTGALAAAVTTLVAGATVGVEHATYRVTGLD